jgi:C1A family cysteine protease
MSSVQTRDGESAVAGIEISEQTGALTAGDGALGLGWLRDLPDIRDYTPEAEEVAPILAGTAASTTKKKASAALPAKTDLRTWFSPIENQGQLGSCTANAGAGLLEYFERRAYGRHVDASRLFIYKVTRDLMKVTGDTGAYLRKTMQTLATFGAPPEEYWPYVIAKYDVEPSAFCYAFAGEYKAIKYFRLDPAGTTPEQLLERIKTNAASGLPSCFGFTVYSSIDQASSSGKIPFPAAKEKTVGGHAIDIAGYDDSLQIKNTDPGGPTTKGAFRIRNSWGTGWGEAGYGWLPYDYVLKGLAADFWSLIKADWIDTGQFS